MRPIVITAGEPAGVGPDLSLIALNSDIPNALVVIADRHVLAERAALRKEKFVAEDFEKKPTAWRAVWHTPVNETVIPQQPSSKNAKHVLAMLHLAVEGIMRGDFSALVTAPISKTTIHAAGFPFVGQTEFLADCVKPSYPVMLLASPKLRVALVTTHLPLAKVASTLNTQMLTKTIMVLNDGLKKYFSLDCPRINVCGLNPHAGENGYLGEEEGKIIMPAILQAQKKGVNVEGPFAADTIIAHSVLPKADSVLAMYHDQGLPAIKLLDFDNTVNMTLGLPFLRVSPDHGVAIEHVGKKTLRLGSMQAALRLAMMAA